MKDLTLTRRELLTGAAALAAYAMLPRTAYAADPVPADRLPYGGTWEGLTGIPGGIPPRSTVSTTIQPYTGSSDTINNAIGSCPAGQTVQLAPGTFNISGNIWLTKSNVTLRGSVNSNGAPATTLNFTADSLILMGDLSWDPTAASQWTTINVAGGATRGSTTVTLASAPTAISVGQLMFISCPANSSIPTESSWTSFLGSRPFTQVVKVTAKNGNDVSFTPPINADYLSGAIQVSVRPTNLTTVMSGLESVSIVRSNGSAATGTIYVRMMGTDSCWLKNVKTYYVAGGGVHHCWLSCTYRTEIRHCEMSHTVTSGSSSSNAYCILNVHSSNWLIEDNYFHDIPNVMPMMGSAGGAFAYNYINDLPYPASSGWLSQIVFFHGSHNHYNLFEGNWLASSENDGSSRNTTWLRNRMRGWDATPAPNGKNANIQPLQCLEDHQANFVIAANVLGEPGKQTQYSGGVEGFTAIYALNTNSGASAMKFGNYNTVNGTIPSSEGSSASVVTSYLHSGKPAWFGSLSWPWCNPLNFTQSNNVQNLPAGYRAVNGRDPSGGTTTAPTAPTNLRITG